MKHFITKRFFWFIAVLGLLIFLHFTTILEPIESGVVRFISPLFSSSYSAAIKAQNFYVNFKQNQALKEKIKNLESQISQLAVDKAKLKKLEEENEQLRGYLGFVKNKKVKYVMANVVSRQDNLLTIDQGQDQKIRNGLVVVNKDGVVIGKIIKIKPQLSQVALVTDKHCQLAASIINAQKTSGLAKGELGLTISMDFIPQTETIKPNDLVITSGLEADIPRGLPIGRVVKVEKSSNQLWQKAVLEPIVNLDHLTMVMVLLPG